MLTAVVREGRRVLMLDNVKGRLDFPALESFLSRPDWSDRLLGGNQMFKGENLVTVFDTGNGMTISADMRSGCAPRGCERARNYVAH